MSYTTQASYLPTFFAASSEESMTEPNQAYSIRELLIRFANGTLPPLSVSDSYTDEEDFTAASNESLDLSDIPTRYQANSNRSNLDVQPPTITDGSEPDNSDESSPVSDVKPVTPET